MIDCEKKHKKQKKRGFTLVEIVVVLVILAILASIAVPTYLGYVSESQAMYCRTRREEIKNQYYSYHMLSPEKTILDFVKDNGVGEVSADKWGVALITGVCPSHGAYEFFADEVSGEMYLYCYEHTVGTNSLAGMSRNLFTTYNNMSEADKKIFLKKYFPNKKNTYVSNDEFRHMLMTELGGKWLDLDERVLNNTDKTYDDLYLQPYIIPTTGEVIIYANSNKNDTGNRWNVNLYFDYKTGKWFEYIDKGHYNIAYLNTPEKITQFYEDLKDTSKFKEVAVSE